jgi:hypothetical protein
MGLKVAKVMQRPSTGEERVDDTVAAHISDHLFYAMKSQKEGWRRILEEKPDYTPEAMVNDLLKHEALGLAFGMRSWADVEDTRRLYKAGEFVNSKIAGLIK